MATAIVEAFREFLTNLEITDTQTSLVSQRRKGVVDAIRADLTLHPDESKLIGSYDRHTLTRYLYEADVDVMVILHYGNNKGWDSPDGTVKALDRFKAILDRAYPNTELGRDRNCITMKFSEFRMDIVPAFSVEGGYYRIPDSVRKQWVSTDPLKFATAITDVNSQMDGSFVPLIKMVKAWNREVGKPIRSFHLECLMHNRYKTYTQGYSYPSMLKCFFQDLPGYLAAVCYDPIMGDRVDGYLDNNAQTTLREIAIGKAKSAADASKEAFEDQDKYSDRLSIAIGEWKSLLGEFFPSYG